MGGAFTMCLPRLRFMACLIICCTSGGPLLANRPGKTSPLVRFAIPHNAGRFVGSQPVNLRYQKSRRRNQQKLISQTNRIRRFKMSDNELEGKTAQKSNSDSQGSSGDRRERRRELKRELRELRHGHPGRGLFGGILLILIGCLFLAGNVFNINFGQWWPLILIAIGVAVLSRAFYSWNWDR